MILFLIDIEKKIKNTRKIYAYVIMKNIVFLLVTYKYIYKKHYFTVFVNNLLRQHSKYQNPRII